VIVSLIVLLRDEPGDLPLQVLPLALMLMLLRIVSISFCLAAGYLLALGPAVFLLMIVLLRLLSLEVNFSGRVSVLHGVVVIAVVLDKLGSLTDVTRPASLLFLKGDHPRDLTAVHHAFKVAEVFLHLTYLCSSLIAVMAIGTTPDRCVLAPFLVSLVRV
jgi:hypothetical protein